jgi:cytidylate kinase
MNPSHDAVLSCGAYMDAQLRDLGPASFEKKPQPFVTISRQTGAGGITIGRLLRDYLLARDTDPALADRWTVFDRNLVAEVAHTYKLPDRVRPYMSEDNVSEFKDTLEELLGLHPARWQLAKDTSETILHLARLGRAILVGRGANVVTAKLDGGFHVRLIGSFARRLAHLMAYDDLSEARAAEIIQKEDRDRHAYVKKYFNRDIDDPLLYDLVINTDRVTYDEAAAMIGRAVFHKAHPVAAATGP